MYPRDQKAAEGLAGLGENEIFCSHQINVLSFIPLIGNGTSNYIFIRNKLAGIVIANTDGLIGFHQVGNQLLIRRFRDDVHIDVLQQDMFVKMITEAAVGSSFANDVLALQVLIGKRVFPG